MTDLTFPDDFGWGLATAAYQIEGAANEGGRSRSIWDTFSHTPGRVLGGDTGDVACDHYHRLDEDLDLLSWVGATYYRFSASWSRVQPDGRGPLNPEGVAFYDRLVDGLLARGIKPWLTLYHWDLPQQLEDAGGWPVRDTAYRFADYGAAVMAALGDRVGHVTTVNEPWCAAFFGYAQGLHAPGRQDPRAALDAAHHLLLGHGLTASALRSARPDIELGITLNLYPVQPRTESPADADAARAADGLINRFFLDALYREQYPKDTLADVEYTGFGDALHDGDHQIIATPTDFLGLNYYTRFVVRARTPEEIAAKPARPTAWVTCPDARFVSGGLPETPMRWEVYPEGLTDTLRRVHAEYGQPAIYITENGAAFDDDVLGPDGAVEDLDRIDYFAAHFAAAQRAIAAGVDLRGYFAWSLLDNFEWSFGYSRRFGVVAVDYDTQQRTPKLSAEFVRSVITANALPAARGKDLN